MLADAVEFLVVDRRPGFCRDAVEDDVFGDRKSRNQAAFLMNDSNALAARVARIGEMDDTAVDLDFTQVKRLEPDTE